MVHFQQTTPNTPFQKQTHQSILSLDKVPKAGYTYQKYKTIHKFMPNLKPDLLFSRYENLLGHFFHEFVDVESARKKAIVVYPKNNELTSPKLVSVPMAELPFSYLRFLLEVWLRLHNLNAEFEGKSFIEHPVVVSRLFSLLALEKYSSRINLPPAQLHLSHRKTIKSLVYPIHLSFQHKLTIDTIPQYYLDASGKPLPEEKYSFGRQIQTSVFNTTQNRRTTLEERESNLILEQAEHPEFEFRLPFFHPDWQSQAPGNLLLIDDLLYSPLHMDMHWVKQACLKRNKLSDFTSGLHLRQEIYLEKPQSGQQIAD